MNGHSDTTAMAILNGDHETREMNGDSTRPLKIAIIGAGIGGLTAAIALRRQGHDVEIYEQADFSTETGAAIHIAPNANGILRRLGIFAETFGANPMNWLTEYTASGELDKSVDLRLPNQQWQHPWLLAHRIELHRHLRLKALDPLASGSARIHLSSRVESVDPGTSTMTLKDGSSVTSDLIIGADGVHSIARKKVTGGNVKPFSSGKSAFRFLVPRVRALEDEMTRSLVQNEGELIIWYGEDRRIVMYPTSDNSVLNFVCVHPETASAAVAGRDWDQKASVDLLLEVYKDFAPAARRLLSQADPQSVKVWTLLDMNVIPSWADERLALLGDAAHPFTPHQGQGAGIAIEDAAALSVVLPFGTTPAEVPTRLKLYQSIRKERADTIQNHSRLAGRDLSEGRPDMSSFTAYNFGHDEFDNATQRFREWRWAQNPDVYWRMPIAFGPMPGPRQTTWGVPRNGQDSTFTTASIKFKTSRTVLQNLFPPLCKGWRFSSPGTVAYASFSQTTLGNMEWLGGSGYSFIGLYIHGVEYTCKDGSVLRGTYMPILFESLADPIISGRDEIGAPKLYTSIDIYRRSTSYRIRTGWQGALWGNFLLEDLVEVDPQTECGSISGEADDGILTYRYHPQVGKNNRGVAAIEHTVWDPFADSLVKPRPQRVFKAGKASIDIDALNWEQLPTMHHVIERLAEVPAYEVVGAKIVEGLGVSDVSTTRPVY